MALKAFEWRTSITNWALRIFASVVRWHFSLKCSSDREWHSETIEWRSFIIEDAPRIFLKSNINLVRWNQMVILGSGYMKKAGPGKRAGPG